MWRAEICRNRKGGNLLSDGRDAIEKRKLYSDEHLNSLENVGTADPGYKSVPIDSQIWVTEQLPMEWKKVVICHIP